MVVPEGKRNGVIRGYTIKCYSNDTNILIKIISVDEGVYSTSFTGLEVYTLYEVKVQAFTKVGNGPDSEAVFIRTDADGKKSFTGI